MVESKVVVTDSEGKIEAIFVYDGTNDAGREDRKNGALKMALESVNDEMTATGKTGNGTIYISENHEIGLLNSAVNVKVGDYL